MRGAAVPDASSSPHRLFADAPDGTAEVGASQCFREVGAARYLDWRSALRLVLGSFLDDVPDLRHRRDERRLEPARKLLGHVAYAARSRRAYAATSRRAYAAWSRHADAARPRSAYAARSRRGADGLSAALVSPHDQISTIQYRARTAPDEPKAYLGEGARVAVA
eukprot:888843-Rhodomonas_salina.1